MNDKKDTKIDKIMKNKLLMLRPVTKSIELDYLIITSLTIVVGNSWFDVLKSTMESKDDISRKIKYSVVISIIALYIVKKLS